MSSIAISKHSSQASKSVQPGRVGATTRVYAVVSARSRIPTILAEQRGLTLEVVSAAVAFHAQATEARLPDADAILLELAGEHAGEDDFARSISEESARTVVLLVNTGGTQDRRSVKLMVAELPKARQPLDLSGLLGLMVEASRPMENRLRGPAEHSMRSAIRFYAGARLLSRQQFEVLCLHVDGLHDKEIAVSLGKSQATVYEHWRRMAHKVGRATKSDVVADFHRFLSRNTIITPAAEAASPAEPRGGAGSSL